MNMRHHSVLANQLKIAFVILTYRSSEDFSDCINSIAMHFSDYSYGLFVIDSYYDEQSSKAIESIALKHGATYKRVENRGYGYGNNVGIAAAKEAMKPDYYIVCNPDTVIECLPEDILQRIAASEGMPDKAPYIIAPDIKNLKNKHQNPLTAKKSEFLSKMLYRGFKFDRSLLRTASFAANRLGRIAFLCLHSRNLIKAVYAPHGSFIVFTSRAIELLEPVFDENIFLFAEELLLAWEAERAGIPVFYCPSIRIRHKEDGSVGFLGGINVVAKESNVYVYEKTHGMSEIPRCQEGGRDD